MKDEKRCKKKHWICIGVGVLLATMMLSVGTADDEIIVSPVIPYQEHITWSVDGNVTLVFNSSDTGTNDIEILFRYYDTSNNITFYGFKSKNITYDWTFVNDTKNYYYLDTNSNQTYIIQVDYSSVSVPSGPNEERIRELLLMLETKNETIRELNQMITLREQELTELNNNLSDAQNEITRLQNEITEYKNQRDQAINDKKRLEKQVVLLQSENENLTSNYNVLQSQYNNTVAQLSFERELNEEYVGTINALQDPWCLRTSTMTFDSKVGRYVRKDISHFSAVWMIIGAISMIIIMLIAVEIRRRVGLGKRVKWRFGKPKTIATATGGNMDFDEIPQATPDTLSELKAMLDEEKKEVADDNMVEGENETMEPEDEINNSVGREAEMTTQSMHDVREIEQFVDNLLLNTGS